MTRQEMRIVRECEATLLRCLVPFVDGLDADLTCESVPGMTPELANIAQDRVMRILTNAAARMDEGSPSTPPSASSTTESSATAATSARCTGARGSIWWTWWGFKGRL